MKNKAYVPMVVLSLILLFLVISPTLFIKAESNYMVDKISVSMVKADSYKEEFEENYNFWEQLKVFYNYSFMWENELQASYVESNGVKTYGVVIEQLEKQLKEIQNYHGLPEMTLADSYSSVVKNTYVKINSERDTEVLEVWAVELICMDYEIYAFMDSRTYAIYDISIRAVSEEFDYDDSKISGSGFMNYLKSITPLEETDEEGFFVESDYGKKAIHLCLMSWNQDSKYEASYCFHQGGYQIIDYEIKKKK